VLSFPGCPLVHQAVTPPLQAIDPIWGGLMWVPARPDDRLLYHPRPTPSSSALLPSSNIHTDRESFFLHLNPRTSLAKSPQGPLTSASSHSKQHRANTSTT
jgi:hypothetical protein